MFSQHPYAESFIGKPHVWTVDYNNSEELEAAIKAIMRSQVRLGVRQAAGCAVGLRCSEEGAPTRGTQTHRPGWAARTVNPPSPVCVCALA